jgi:Flp pilus assembly pilin Flp
LNAGSSAGDPRAGSEFTRGEPRGERPPVPEARRTQITRANHQSGQGLIEYGLILALMAVVCAVSLLFFGDQLSSLLSLIASAV